MRSILRFILLNLFILSFVGLIELLLIQSVFSSPVKIKTLLSNAHIYTDVTVFVNKKLQESDEPVHIVLSESAVQHVLENVIDQTWEWASGATSKPPSISLTDILVSSGVSQKDITQLSSMQDELMKSFSDPEFAKELPPESQQGMEMIQNFGNNGNAISLESKLFFLKTVVKVFKIGIPVLGVLSLIDLLLILLICTNNQSRSMWMFFTFFLTSGAFVLGAVLFALPKLFIPFILSHAESGDSSYGEGVLRVIIGPLSNVLYHQHLAVAVGVFCIAVVCLLARLMVFRGNPVVMVEKKKEKSKKVKDVITSS